MMGLFLIIRISLILPLAIGKIEFDRMEKIWIDPSDFYGLVNATKLLSFTECYLLCRKKFATECFAFHYEPTGTPECTLGGTSVAKGVEVATGAEIGVYIPYVNGMNYHNGN